MIGINYYKWPFADISRVSYATGDSAKWLGGDEALCFATYYLSGELEITDSDDARLVGFKSNPAQGLALFDWPAVTSTYLANADTELLCFSDNGTGRRSLQLLDVPGTATLPSGWGFLVAAGLVSTSDSVTAGVDNYYAPRGTDIGLTGTATLILIQ